MNSTIATACALVLLSCAARETVPLNSTTTTAAKAEVADETAIKDITAARCTRASSCGDVGKGRAWSDMDACTTDVRKATRDYLAGQTCDNGIDPTSFSRCLDAIHNEPCGSPHQMGERWTSCDQVKLCR